MSTADFALWLLHIRWRLIRGDIVIADRYVADFDVEMDLKLPSRPVLRRRLVNVVRFLAKRPQGAYLLDLDPSLAKSRAQPDGDEFDFDVVVARYRQRSGQYGLASIDAARSFDPVSKEVTRRIFEAYMAGYGTKGNLLYFSNPWQLNR